jgi:hypothetical protein
MGIVEDRAGENGKLVATLAACELSTRVYPPNDGVAATWAFNTEGPAKFSEDFAASVIGRELLI